jgi:hypothetical protein
MRVRKGNQGSFPRLPPSLATRAKKKSKRNNGQNGTADSLYYEHPPRTTLMQGRWLTSGAVF